MTSSGLALGGGVEVKVQDLLSIDCSDHRQRLEPRQHRRGSMVGARIAFAAAIAIAGAVLAGCGGVVRAGAPAAAPESPPALTPERPPAGGVAARIC